MASCSFLSPLRWASVLSYEVGFERPTCAGAGILRGFDTRRLRFPATRDRITMAFPLRRRKPSFARGSLLRVRLDVARSLLCVGGGGEEGFPVGVLHEDCSSALEADLDLARVCRADSCGEAFADELERLLLRERVGDGRGAAGRRRIVLTAARCGQDRQKSDRKTVSVHVPFATPEGRRLFAESRCRLTRRVFSRPPVVASSARAVRR